MNYGDSRRAYQYCVMVVNVAERTHVVVDIRVVEEVCLDGAHNQRRHAVGGKPDEADLAFRLILLQDFHAAARLGYPVELLVAIDAVH